MKDETRRIQITLYVTVTLTVFPVIDVECIAMGKVQVEGGIWLG